MEIQAILEPCNAVEYTAWLVFRNFQTRDVAACLTSLKGKTV